MPRQRLNAAVRAARGPIQASPSPTNPIGDPPRRLERPAKPESSRTERLFQAGLVAGTIGYAVAALFFAVAGLLDGQSSFDIATVLRGTLFFGTHAGPDAMVITGPVFDYNGPRLITFLIAGVFITWLASEAERAPQVWLVAFMLLLFVAAPVLGVPTVFEEKVQAELSPWVVTVATSLASLAMAAYLWTVYPTLRVAVRGKDARSIGN